MQSAPPTMLDPVESLNSVVSSIQDQVVAGNLTITVDNEVLQPSPETFYVDPNPTISCDRGHVPREDICRKLAQYWSSNIRQLLFVIIWYSGGFRGGGGHSRLVPPLLKKILKMPPLLKPKKKKKKKKKKKCLIPPGYTPVTTYPPPTDVDGAPEKKCRSPPPPPPPRLSAFLGLARVSRLAEKNSMLCPPPPF